MKTFSQTTHTPKKAQIRCACEIERFWWVGRFQWFPCSFWILGNLAWLGLWNKIPFLASSLAGSVRALLTDLNKTQRMDYKSLVDIFNRRFGFVERPELFRAQLQTRVKWNKETIPELAQSEIDPTRIPHNWPECGEYMAIEHFIDALPEPDIRLRLREARPIDIIDINKAESIAIRLETHRMTDAQRSASTLSLNPTHSKEFESLR